MINPIFPILAGVSLVLAGCSNNDDDNTGGAPSVLTCSGTAAQTERLFLQQLGSDSVIVKWRPSSDAGTEVSSVCFGTDMAALPADSKSAATITATGHQEGLAQRSAAGHTILLLGWCCWRG